MGSQRMNFKNQKNNKMKLVRKTNPTFNSILNDILNDDFFKPVSKVAHSFRPPVNIKETDAAFQMEISVPGLSKKDVVIDVDGDLLSISYEKPEIKTEEGAEIKENYKMREFGTRSFKRTFTIPENVEADSIGATMKNGILNVTLPKVEVPEPEKKVVTIK